MPIHVERLQPNLYYTAWHGSVTNDETKRMLDWFEAQRAAHNEAGFVVMVFDTGQMRNLPNDFSALRRAYTLLKDGLTIYVAAPQAWKLMSNTTNKSGWGGETIFRDTREEALAYAMPLLAANSGVGSAEG